MTDEEKEKIRRLATLNAQPLVDALAPLYLGRTCPLKSGATGDGRECDGPKCMLYTPLNDNPQKPDAITGGACGLTLAVSRITELVNIGEANLAIARQQGNIFKPH